ncbi:hypothetical protein GCM10019016_107450 [Streptomyces prasinosporus]|uniref:Uncharacterized protein n=1 Tax=Streptomyces prasinosporus TaxID=68256 RepID=A0ABP6U9N7_9ACTN
MVAPLSRSPSPGSSSFSPAAEPAEATGDSGEGEAAADHCDRNPPTGMLGTAEGDAGSETAEGEDGGGDAGAAPRSSSPWSRCGRCGSNPLPTGSLGTATGPPAGGTGGVKGAPGAGGVKGAPGAGAGAGGVKGAPGAGAGTEECPAAPTACGGGVSPGNGGTGLGEDGGATGGEAGAGGEEGEGAEADEESEGADAADEGDAFGPELSEAFCVYQAGGA